MLATPSEAKRTKNQEARITLSHCQHDSTDQMCRSFKPLLRCERQVRCFNHLKLEGECGLFFSLCLTMLPCHFIDKGLLDFQHRSHSSHIFVAADFSRSQSASLMPSIRQYHLSIHAVPRSSSHVRAAHLFTSSEISSWAKRPSPMENCVQDTKPLFLATHSLIRQADMYSFNQLCQTECPGSDRPGEPNTVGQSATSVFRQVVFLTRSMLVTTMSVVYRNNSTAIEFYCAMSCQIVLRRDRFDISSRFTPSHPSTGHFQYAATSQVIRRAILRSVT